MARLQHPEPRSPSKRGTRAVALVVAVAVLALVAIAVLDSAGPGGGGATAVVSLEPSRSTGPTPSPLPTPAPTPSPSATPESTPTPTPPVAPTAKPAVKPTSPAKAGPLVVPFPAEPMACTYRDYLTPRRTDGDWARTLLDTDWMVASTYVPPDLVSTDGAGLSAGFSIRRIVKADLTAMAAAARAAGAAIDIRSAYRSYWAQRSLFNLRVKQIGYAEALTTAARPGHSEHQLGTTLDFGSARDSEPWSGSDWATSPAGAWMAAHAWEYGFVMSYPKGSFAQSCYAYEPWHYRYLGRDRAAAIHESAAVARLFLWPLQ